MTRQAILEQFDRLNVWSRGDQRAPHKPLLVLYALGHWSRGEGGDIPFRDAEPVLTSLLKEFGPSRQSYHPEYPFWRLRNDGVWTVHAPADLTLRHGHTDPVKSELLAHNVVARFAPEVQDALRADPSLVTDIAARLLENHFPESIHGDILSAVGLTLGGEADAKKRKRDPQFRLKVLTAYEWRGVVCGFDVRLGSVSVALDAAHIRWHQAGGPDEENNGLALCVLHHKLFDLGAFTVNREGAYSPPIKYTDGGVRGGALMRFHSKPVKPPQRPEWRPQGNFLDWHARQVFKGNARHITRSQEAI